MRYKIATLALLSTLSATTLFAQGEMDAYKLSKNELTGTARSVSMGGAFGALGGDISAIAINPAGIGVYTKSELSTTINFQNTNSKTTFNGNDEKKGKFKFTFDNFGAVVSLPLWNDDVPRINFGFTYNKLKSFDRRIDASGRDAGSLTHYMAYRANGGFTGIPAAEDDLSLASGNSAWDREDWLGVLGYNSYLINRESDGFYKSSILNYNDQPYMSDFRFHLREKGYINSYDFNVGTNILDKLSVGLTIAVTDIDYKIFTEYQEDLGGSWSYDEGYGLFNHMKTEGTGWQLKAGLIFKPINELRFGVAYHSPTWYKMTDYFTADLEHNLSGLKGTDVQIDYSKYKDAVVSSYDGYDGVYDYKLRTPDKWTFSMAGVIGKSAILSVDYELTNYKNMKLKDDFYDNGNPALDIQNDAIKQDYRASSTLRVGGEYRVTPQFSVRAGYAWMQSALKKQVVNNEVEVLSAGSFPHVINEGDTHHITFGLGYRFTPKFYMDVAFVAMNRKDDLYMFPTVDNDFADLHPDRIKLKTNQFRGLLTLGYRF